VLKVLKKINFNYSSKVNFFLLIAVFTYLTLTELGDPQIRISMISNDDSFIAHAYAYKFPEIFEDDYFIKIYQTWANTSLLNFIPAILFKYFEVNPLSLFLPVTTFQNVYLYLSVSLIVYHFVKSKSSIWFASLFMFFFTPHFFNLGWFGELDWGPYGMWFALPFLLNSFYFLLQGKWTLSFVFAFLTQSIHPSMGVLWLSYIFIVYIFEIKKTKEKFSFTLFLLPIINFVWQFLNTQNSDQIKTPQDYFIINLASNGHYHFFNPFDSMNLPLTLRAWAYTFSFGLIGYLFISTLKNTYYKSLYNKLIFVAFSYGVFEQIGVYFKNELLVKLSGTRFSVFFLSISICLTLSYFCKMIMDKSILQRTAGLISILFPVPGVLFSFITLQILNRFKVFKRNSIILFSIYVLFAGSVGSIFIVWYHIESLRWFTDNIYAFFTGTIFDTRTMFNANYFWTPLYINQKLSFITFVIILLFIISSSLILSRKPVIQNVSLFFLISCLCFIGNQGAQNDLKATGYRKSLDEANARKDSQIWIRNNTPTDANFIAFSSPYGFRSLTQRSMIQNSKSINPYVYTSWLESNNRKLDKYTKDYFLENPAATPEQYYIDFAKDFNVDYIYFDKVQYLSFQLPVEYENDFYTIYRIY
jgi:hypothetical protein